MTQVENSRQSLNGVSLDEEMSRMIKYQHAPATTARVITTIYMVVDTVMNGMGSRPAWRILTRGMNANSNS